MWVPTESIRRHIADALRNTRSRRELAAFGRAYTHLRLVVSGVGDEDDDEE